MSAPRESWRTVNARHWACYRGDVKKVEGTWYAYDFAGREIGGYQTLTEAKRAVERQP